MVLGVRHFLVDCVIVSHNPWHGEHMIELMVGLGTPQAPQQVKTAVTWHTAAVCRAHGMSLHNFKVSIYQLQVCDSQCL